MHKITAQVLGWIWEYGVINDIDKCCRAIEESDKVNEIVQDVRNSGLLISLRQLQQLKYAATNDPEFFDKCNSDDYIQRFDELLAKCKFFNSADFIDCIIALYFAYQACRIYKEHSKANLRSKSTFIHHYSPITWRQFKNKCNMMFRTHDVRSHIARQHQPTYDALLRHTKGAITQSSLMSLIKYLMITLPIKVERFTSQESSTPVEVDIESDIKESEEIETYAESIIHNSNEVNIERCLEESPSNKRKCHEESDLQPNTKIPLIEQCTEINSLNMDVSHVSTDKFQTRYSRFGTKFRAKKPGDSQDIDINESDAPVIDIIKESDTPDIDIINESDTPDIDIINESDTPDIDIENENSHDIDIVNDNSEDIDITCEANSQDSNIETLTLKASNSDDMTPKRTPKKPIMHKSAKKDSDSVCSVDSENTDTQTAEKVIKNHYKDDDIELVSTYQSYVERSIEKEKRDKKKLRFKKYNNSDGEAWQIKMYLQDECNNSDSLNKISDSPSSSSSHGDLECVILDNELYSKKFNKRNINLFPKEVNSNKEIQGIGDDNDVDSDYDPDNNYPDQIKNLDNFIDSLETLLHKLKMKSKLLKENHHSEPSKQTMKNCSNYNKLNNKNITTVEKPPRTSRLDSEICIIDSNEDTITSQNSNNIINSNNNKTPISKSISNSDIHDNDIAVVNDEDHLSAKSKNSGKKSNKKGIRRSLLSSLKTNEYKQTHVSETPTLNLDENDDLNVVINCAAKEINKKDKPLSSIISSRRALLSSFKSNEQKITRVSETPTFSVDEESSDIVVTSTSFPTTSRDTNITESSYNTCLATIDSSCDTTPSIIEEEITPCRTLRNVKSSTRISSHILTRRQNKQKDFDNSVVFIKENKKSRKIQSYPSSRSNKSEEDTDIEIYHTPPSSPQKK